MLPKWVWLIPFGGFFLAYIIADFLLDKIYLRIKIWIKKD